MPKSKMDPKYRAAAKAFDRNLRAYYKAHEAGKAELAKKLWANVVPLAEAVAATVPR